MKNLSLTDLSLTLITNQLSQIVVILLKANMGHLDASTKKALDDLMRQQQNLIAQFAKENQS